MALPQTPVNYATYACQDGTRAPVLEHYAQAFTV